NGQRGLLIIVCRTTPSTHDQRSPALRIREKGTPVTRKRQLVSGIAALAAATLTLSACGGGGGADAEEAGTQEVRVWLVGSDTPDEARQYLVDTFAEQHDNAELVIEEQVWAGLVDKLSTSLSGSDSPDVVEMGN